MSTNVNIQVTDVAAEIIRKRLSERNEATATTATTAKADWTIKIGTRRAGCSGYEYYLEYLSHPQNQSSPQSLIKVENNGVNLFVEEKQLEQINGVILDYKVQELEEGFVFGSSRAKSCGCGLSFNL